MKKIFLLFFAVSLSLHVFCSDKLQRYFWSPYEGLNWQQVSYCDAEFHTHPGLGDEQYDPHQTVDRYHAEGYKILTLSGHDYHIPTEQIGSIYPWTQLASIYDKIKDVPNPAEDNKTYSEIANEPYQNRNPIELGMVSVEGCEVSAPHHIVSLFNSFSEGKKTEAETFKAISELNGIAYFAHPGRYVERWGITEYWYADFYKRFDMLLGQSVYNREDSHPEDRTFFDKIAHLLGHERPIWLFGEDDMHTEGTLGWNRNVILVENFKPGSMHSDITDGSARDVRKALESGKFYLWKPTKKYNKRAFNITNIRATNSKIELTLDHSSLVKEIRWVTYDPSNKKSVVIHTGKVINLDNVPAYAKFLRAEVQGEAGTIYTQPFYIVGEVM